MGHSVEDCLRPHMLEMVWSGLLCLCAAYYGFELVMLIFMTQTEVEVRLQQSLPVTRLWISGGGNISPGCMQIARSHKRVPL